MATTIRPAATEEDLLRTPKAGRKYELVDGQIRVSPAGTRHGRVCVRLVARLHAFVEDRRLGYVFESSTGFRLPGGNVRVPDVSFVSKGRFSGEQVPSRKDSPTSPPIWPLRCCLLTTVRALSWTRSASISRRACLSSG